LRAFLLGLSFLGLSFILSAEPQRISLLIEKPLQGWEGDAEYFHIEENSIVERRLDHSIRGNQFLVSYEEFHNFDFVFESKLFWKGKNAGIQFWSQRVPSSTKRIGYQCDTGSFKDEFHEAVYTMNQEETDFLPPPLRKIFPSK
jgi:hypothetical protein